MGYANNIGRVGALAVTLGVGWAIASSAGAAYAETGDSSSSSESSTASASATPGKQSTSARPDSSPDTGGSTTTDDDAAAATETPRAGKSANRGAAGQDGEDAEAQAAEAAVDEAAVDEDAPNEAADVDDAAEAEVGVQTVSASSATVDAAIPEPPRNSAKPSASAPRPAPTPVTTPVAAPQATTTSLTPRDTPGPAAPLQGSGMLASLAAIRNGLERNAIRRTNPATGLAATLIADDTPNVLVIGVDGTNLSKVLANPELTKNFFALMQGGTTAASTIVGHTTVSNPSWSSILTGAWGEKTGVINNVYTPWTYEKWPSVFTQLEAQNPDIETTSIANWNVISAIAASGLGVDNLFNVPEQEDDPRWFKADDVVGDLTEIAIANASADVANFMFSYFVGVDENGHMFGGDSPEYLESLANFDRNLGEIMAAVDTWEAATGEQWTIMMVTDHGHQPQLGFGHGFQSPAETTTFVVANNPDLFQEGGVNLQYSIVDVTATVMTLFGFEPAEDTDGVSLTDLDDSTVTPGDNDALLRKALQDAVAMYGYPDIGTNIALSVRTIAATIPYYVDNIVNGITSGLQSLADQDIFLISPLAALAILPVKLIGDIVYIAVNIPAQIIARLTGVTGASIFPLVRPAPPSFPESPEESSTPDLVAVACTEGRVSTAVFSCGAPTIAA